MKHFDFFCPTLPIFFLLLIAFLSVIDEDGFNFPPFFFFRDALSFHAFGQAYRILFLGNDFNH